MATASNTPAAYTEAWLAGLDGAKFYTRTYSASAPRAVLLFVHGFAEHIARYQWAHSIYASKGITVFTFDQRGFGRTALDKDNKSKGSSYGRTSWHHQLGDIEWWLKLLKERYPDLPLFLMGHSMGGGLVLGFNTRLSGPPAKETLSLISGTIASSPLVLQTFPAAKIARVVGSGVSAVYPGFLIPASIRVEDLTHDEEVVNAVLADPLMIQKASLKCLHDMLSGGEQLLWNNYKNWQKSAPVFIIHGDEDKITSCKASREFFDKLDVQDKEYKTYEDGFHELVHEPGMKEGFVEDCISWVLKRVERRNGLDSKAKL